MEPQTTSQITKALVNIDTKILTLIYKDLAQPSVQKAGQALSTVLGFGNTVLLPLKLANEKADLWFKKHMEAYRKRLEEVPMEQIVAVPPEIGVPILERLERTTNEKLSELYVTLLASASIADTAHLAHPRFASLIESITPDEAKLLEYLAKEKTAIPYITATAQEPHTADSAFRSRPIVTVLPKTTTFESSNYLAIGRNATLYFDNLVALGLFFDEESRMTADDNGAYHQLTAQHQALIDHRTRQFIANYQLPNATTNVKSGFYTLTEWGRSFMRACSPTPLQTQPSTYPPVAHNPTLMHRCIARVELLNTSPADFTKFRLEMEARHFVSIITCNTPGPYYDRTYKLPSATYFNQTESTAQEAIDKVKEAVAATQAESVNKLTARILVNGSNASDFIQFAGLEEVENPLKG